MSAGQEIRTTERAVIDAAFAWWHSHRPVGWDLESHLRHPTVNAGATRWTKKLALAVADEMRASIEQEERQDS